jgi:ribonuclease P protein component
MVLKQHTLSRNERLKSRKQIDKLFTSGRYFNIPPLRLNYNIGLAGENDHLQMGVGVSGKHFKKAVDRNRVKRLIREAWRLQKTGLAMEAKQNGKSLKVFIIYTGRDLPDFKLIYEKTGSAIVRLSSLINETDPAHT